MQKTNSQKIRAIYHRFCDPGEDIYEGIRIYKENTEYELVIEEKGDKIKYTFQAYGWGKHWPDMYFLPIESLNKIDLSENAENLRDQLIHMEIIYEEIDRDEEKESYVRGKLMEQDFIMSNSLRIKRKLNSLKRKVFI